MGWGSCPSIRKIVGNGVADRKQGQSRFQGLTLASAECASWRQTLRISRGTAPSNQAILKNKSCQNRIAVRRRPRGWASLHQITRSHRNPLQCHSQGCTRNSPESRWSRFRFDTCSPRAQIELTSPEAWNDPHYTDYHSQYLLGSVTTSSFYAFAAVMGSWLGDFRGKFLFAGQDELVLAGKNLVLLVSENIAATASFFSLQRIRLSGGFSRGKA
jgi:hypothetical protein